MRQAVRAIIVRDGYLLVIHRNKFGQEYFTLPGGGIDPGETAEQALYRELQEETGITVANPRLVITEEAGDPFGTQYVYLCDYASGEPTLHPDSEEAKINLLGQNLYEPRWMPLASLSDDQHPLPFRSELLKRTLLECINQNFSNAPVQISSK